LFTSNSPLSFSFLILFLSIFVAIFSLGNIGVLFPSVAIVISFSTGIIILFCYCSRIVNFEKNNFLGKFLLISSPPFLFLLLLFSNTERLLELVVTCDFVIEYQLGFILVLKKHKGFLTIFIV
jgi:hypothetical protein